MFSSLSRATPQTQATTSFVASGTITIVPQTPFTILVNGTTPPDPNSVTVSAGNTVTAVVTTPDDYTWYKFYYYTINGVPQTFAVVNRSLYTIHVNPADALLRWYLYTVTKHTLTYQSSTGVNTPVILGSKFDAITTDVHVVLDPISESVYFYNNHGIQLSKVTLPAAPIAYAKVPEKQSVVVLILGGEAYEIYLDSSSAGLAPFYARRNYSEFSDTTFVTQLPGEDLISYLRRARAKKAIPPATCITYNGTHLWAGGNGSVWVVDPNDNFRLLHNFDVDEYVLNIAPLPNDQGAVLVCQSQKVYTIDYTGNVTEIYQGTAVWEPALFNDRVYIPESEIGYLKVYNPTTKTFEADITTPEFSPSYTKVVDNKMYVCGHDNETVLVFDQYLNQTKLVFPNKVTWISVVGNSYIASHWLKDYKILDVKDLYRIVQVNFKSRSGPITHIGTDESLVIPLGNDEIYAYTPQNAWLWVNGRRTYSNGTRGTALTGGDYIALNYSARVAGKSRTNCIIGDTAYDYDIEAFDETYFPRNIELPIQIPQTLGVHTRKINLPRFFTPCHMSIEFGTIKVNDLAYYGDTLVNPTDTITVEINTRGNNSLPVFTIGARQFVIPISTNIPTNIDPIVTQEVQLEPGTAVQFNITINEEGSKYDYIIPGYYDIVVKRNDVDITGNYYTQFGKGDNLVVQFTSSKKLYDIKDVYLLGFHNYQFRAKNKIPPAINYLDYGTLTYPYARQFDNQFSGETTTLFNMAINYYSPPDVQYTTANLTIGGLDPEFVGNLAVLGGDSYLVINGNLITNTSNISVVNGDQVSLARNVVNYFDVPVTVVQSLPTDDEDGFAEVEVGIWRILNRSIEPISQADAFHPASTDRWTITETGTVDNIELIKSAYELSRLSTRKIISNSEALESKTETKLRFAQTDITSSNSATDLALDAQLTRSEQLSMTASQATDEAMNLIANDGSSTELITGLITTVASSMGEHEQVLLNYSTPVEIAKWYNTDRKIFSSTGQLDLLMLKNRSGSQVGFYVDNQPRLNMPAVEFDFDDSITNETISVDRYRESQRTIFSSVGTLMLEEFFKGTTYAADRIRNLSDHNLKFSIPLNQSTKDPAHTASKVENFVEMLSTVTKTIAEFEFRRAVFADKTSSTITQTNYESSTRTNPVNSYANYVLNLKTSTEKLLDLFYQPPRNYFSNLENNLILDHKYQWQGFIETDTSITTKYEKISEVDTLTNLPLPTIGGDGYIYAQATYLKEQSKNFIFETTPGNLDALLDYVFVPTNFLLEQPEIKDRVKEIFKSSTQNFITNSSPFNLTVEPKYFINGSQASLVWSQSSILDMQVRLSSQGQLIFNPITQDLATLNIMKNHQDFNAAESPTSDHIVMHYVQDLIEQSIISMQPEAAQLEFVKNRQNFVPFVVPASGQVVMSYEHDLPVQTVIPMQPSADQSGFGTSVDMYWHTIGDSPAGQASMQFIPEQVVEHYSHLIYYRDREVLGVTVNMKPKQVGDSSTLGRIGLDIEKQGLKNYAKINWQRERPQYYYMGGLSVPEFDQGEIWDNEIETVYGAFATQEDAALAASKYQKFRPFLILDTNLWTYRVLLDTGLVCSLPKGRYPIAWLLRGG